MLGVLTSLGTMETQAIVECFGFFYSKKLILTSKKFIFTYKKLR